MNSIVKSGVYAAVTIVLVLAAVLTVPGLNEPEFYSDQGEEFFPEFTEPGAATALEVVAFEEATAELKPFRVEFKENRWTIPSHHGYPADAKERMAESAGMLIGLRKASVRSDDSADHALFGVLDPSESGLEEKGYGTLIKFEDKGGNALAALIVGKEVEGKTNTRYVRVPDKKRTYTAELPIMPSTKFEDWIETDLLDVSSYDVERLVFDNYSIDEVNGTRVPGELIVASKKDYKWSVEGLAENEEVDETGLSDVTTSLGSLAIVGVRPKPAGLSRDLTRAEGIELTAQSILSLRSRGFFVASDGHLYSNEGDLEVCGKDGVRHTLRFGEILYGAGEEVTAGTAEEEEKTEEPAPEGAGQAEGAAPEGGAEGAAEGDKASLAAHRYLMVTAAFDESLLAKPEGEPLPQEELDKRRQARDAIEKVAAAVTSFREKNEQKLPESLALLTQGETPLLEALPQDPWQHDLVLVPKDDGFAVKSLGADGQEGGEGANHDVSSDDWKHEDDLKKLASDMEQHDKKVEDGQKAAKKLMERFAPWYYVIDDASFKKLHKARAELVKEKTPVEEEKAGEPEEGEVHEDAGEGDDAEGTDEEDKEEDGASGGDPVKEDGGR
ncbi:MAG: DUF4340 domain-containing protein [Planctomycetes bacterium]|nr:DUF4340 domain-containing protein [Planctomycetota bacterium]